jgi:hypothetical protein
MSQTQTAQAFLAATPAGSLPHRDAKRAMRDLLTRILAKLRTPTRRETEISRLDHRMLRDVGLVPGEPPHAPLWGHGGIMWRP